MSITSTAPKPQGPPHTNVLGHDSLYDNPVLCSPSLYLCSSNLTLSNHPDFHQWLRTSKCIYPALLSPSNSGSLLDSPVQMLNGCSKPTWSKLLSIPQYSSQGSPSHPSPSHLGFFFHSLSLAYGITTHIMPKLETWKPLPLLCSLRLIFHVLNLTFLSCCP